MPETQTRTIELAGKTINYRIRRSKKARYMRLQIKRGSELEVVLPYRMSLNAAVTFIHEKSNWIKKHLQPVIPNKNKFMLFGEELRIDIEYELFSKKTLIVLRGNELKIKTKNGDNKNPEYYFTVWLRHSAKNFLINRAYILAGKYSFNVNKIFIRNQKTRWGSCSSKKNISLNYKLLMLPKELIDYVIIHELCHLKEMNHSKSFWQLVGSIFLNYKQLKKELRTFAINLDM